MLKKQKILDLKNVYTANAFGTDSGFFIGAGSETDPVVHLYSLADRTTELIENCPGGMMSFIPVPGKSDTFVTIMGLYPPFIGRDAGLHIHQKTNEGWNTVKAMELPFAHRCEFIRYKGVDYLVAATVSEHKDNPADWSRPGDIHIISMKENVSVPWKSKILGAGITRNHGMVQTKIKGIQTLCISGANGVFKLVPGSNGDWRIEKVFEKEVSEMTFIDLDRDGVEEMVTIEPFHGNTLNMYKKQHGQWNLKYSDTLSFGHGLSSGMFNQVPVVVAGNRSGSDALEIFTVGDLTKGIVNRRVIEENAGPTQTQVFSHGKTDYILSANQRKNEVALYSGSLD